MSSRSAYPLTELIALAQSVAVQAGEYALERRRGTVEVADTKSNERDIVTAVDREVEQLIRHLISSDRPDDAFYGEESGTGSGSTGITWVVDPIDGTVNFYYGLPNWAVSIAAVEGDVDSGTWKPLVGVVFNPNTGEVFSATADGIADCNGLPLHARVQTDLRRALVATGFAYDRTSATNQAELLARIHGHIADVRRFGAASLDLCAVASGRVDAYYESHTSPWDYAAAWLIAERAGARVAGRDGGRPNSDLVLAAAEPLWTELHGLITSD
ncbi:MAG TPA: inositol monophosphatase family protein [Microbacteriaceae bacterium]|nr:inositol monophosphatase family protein [Microbacteriaceae bacterium]